MQAVHEPIKLTILTGFLGSGKTSFLNQLLQQPQMSDAMVLINEFGEVGLDHLLVETANDAIIELSNGCLCCTIRGDLVERLEDFLHQKNAGQWQKTNRLLIETTGLADPVPILQLFMTHPLFVHSFRHDGLVTMVDAINGINTLDHYEEARRQVALADYLVVSKSEILPENDMLQPLLMRLKTLNQGAKMLINKPDRPLDVSLLQGGYSKIDFEPEQQHHHRHHHEKSIDSFCLTCDRPLPIVAIEAFFGRLRDQYGARILRLKGLVATNEHCDKPLIVHAAQGLFHPPQWLPSWPDSHRQTRLIFIVDGMNSVEREEIEALFESLSGQIGIDRADFQALSDNPLAIAGLRYI